MQSSENTYVFIDSQNLNLGTSKNLYKNGKLVYKGWRIDMKRFYVYLNHKYRTQKIFLFLGYMNEHRKMYKKFKDFGYELIFKPTIKDSHGKAKGNIDADLVLYAAAKEYPNYDKAIIVSGDGDFYCLYEYLENKGKLKRILIPNELSESSLLENFNNKKTYLQFEKEKLEMKNGRRRSIPRR